MGAGVAGEPVIVGRVLGAWGVQGWVRIYSWTDPAEGIFSYCPWRLSGREGEFSVCDWRRVGPRLVARLSDIDTPEAAAALADQEILVARQQLPKLPPGEYYWHDLENLEVVNLQGHCWGRIQRLIPTGAHDVIEVVAADGRVTLIPFVTGQYVHLVDLERASVQVDWPREWEE